MATKKKQANAPKPRGKAKSVKKVAKAAASTAKRTRKPKPEQSALPEMEHLGQDATLDRLCKGLAGTRAELNDLRAEEDSLKTAALHRMQELGRATYQRHGVELARIPGDEKLRVRAQRNETTSERVDDDDTVIDADEDGEDTAADTEMHH